MGTLSLENRLIVGGQKINRAVMQSGAKLSRELGASPLSREFSGLSRKFLGRYYRSSFTSLWTLKEVNEVIDRIKE